MPIIQENKDDDEKLLNKNKASINVYMKYSGMGIQMALIIAAFSWLGVKMDDWLNTEPLFTVVLSLSGVALSMYVFIKQILTDSKYNNKDTNDIPK